MRTISFERFAALASLFVVLGALLYSLFFIWIVEGGGSNVQAVWYFLLMLGGLGTVPVLVALYYRLWERDAGFALTAFLLGLGAALGAVLHGSYNLGVEITPPDPYALGQEDVARGALRYLVLGLFFLLSSWLIQRGGTLPIGLAYLGYLGGAILVFIYIGRLFDFIEPSSYVSLIPPIVYGFVVHPLWYFWLGLTLWRGAAGGPPRRVGTTTPLAAE
jgi:hypothetical protein